MSQMQPTSSNAATQAAALADIAVSWPIEDPDLALGCECADPALQIERWAQEAMGAGSEAH